MNDVPSSLLSRRELLKKSGQLAAVASLATATLPRAYAGEDNTIRIALVGCGGRGSGAAVNALSTKLGPTQLVAMADVFEDRLSNSYNGISASFEKQMDVPPERRFIGFDGYKQAMDCLRPGDVVILTTPPAFRWVHFTYAIEKGLNVFMEKPVTIDGPTTRKMLELGERSVAKNLKVGVGLMCRHCDARGELHKRIEGGEMGDVTLLRAYRVVGPTGSAFAKANAGGMTELQYQIRNFHAFLWLSGGAYSDFLIHNIDECCWMKNAWPVEAKGYGGRHYRGDYVDQNFDSYTTEFTFADGAKLMLEGRCMDGCSQEFASYAHGTKGSAVISASSHWPSRARMYKSQNMNNKDDLVWTCEPEKLSPYQAEWDHLMDAIRNDKPYNEVKRGAEASLVTSMGRMACHTGQTVKWDDIYNSDHEFAPQVGELKLDGPAPLLMADGKYSVPMPGLSKRREYA